MAKIIQDRVLETSSTEGSGSYSLLGAVQGYRAISTVCQNSDIFEYFAEAIDTSGAPTGEWEIGIGIWNTGNTITRAQIYASSNANSAVVWAVGTKRIGITLAANNIRELNNAIHPFMLAGC